MLQQEFSSHEELMKVWLEAKAKAKEAEAQDKACKVAAIDMNIPDNTPLYEGYGVVIKTRQTYEVPKALVESVVGAENVDMFVEVKKTLFDSYLKDKLESEELTDADVKLIKSQYEVKGSSEYLEVKKLEE